MGGNLIFDDILRRGMIGSTAAAPVSSESASVSANESGNSDTLCNGYTLAPHNYADAEFKGFLHSDGHRNHCAFFVQENGFRFELGWRVIGGSWLCELLEVGIWN